MVGRRIGWARAVALSGDTLVASAPNDDDRATDAGAAYVFVRSGDTWSQQEKITAADGATQDWFGLGLDVDGDTLAVSAGDDDDHGDYSGSAYVFTRSGGDWSLQQKLNASDAKPGDYFGWPVDVQGDRLLVGACLSDTNGAEFGGAYAFDRSGGSWIQTRRLVPPDGIGGAKYGAAVALAGDTAFVGAPDDNDAGYYSGSVYFANVANVAPSTVHDLYYALSGVQKNVAAPGVLANDQDSPGAVLSATKVGDPSHGTLTLNSDGSFTYQSSPGYFGYDSFTYTASDGLVSSGAPQIVTVLVRQDPTLTLSAPSTCGYRSAKLTGRMLDATGSTVPSATIVIEQSANNVNWSTVTKVSTVKKDAAGWYFAYTATPAAKTYYRARFEGDNTYGDKISSVKMVLPAARVIRTSSWTRLARYKRYYATGFIEPRHFSTSGRVTVRAYKRASNGRYYYKRSFTAAYSYYSLTRTRYKATVRFGYRDRGTWKLVPYHAKDGTNAAASGTVDYIVVR